MHRYPEQRPNRRIIVRIDHLLEDLDRQDLEVGAWLNVIGYIKGRPEQTSLSDFRTGRSGTTSRQRSRSRSHPLELEAIMLWSAGAINLGAYEQALEARKQADIAMAS